MSWYGVQVFSTKVQSEYDLYLDCIYDWLAACYGTLVAKKSHAFQNTLYTAWPSFNLYRFVHSHLADWYILLGHINLTNPAYEIWIPLNLLQLKCHGHPSITYTSEQVSLLITWMWIGKSLTDVFVKMYLIPKGERNVWSIFPLDFQSLTM